jgi:hypothetical protein
MDIKNKLCVLSLPFDRLRANGLGPVMVSLSNHKLRANGKKYFFSIMDSLVNPEIGGLFVDKVDKEESTFTLSLS